MIRHVLAPKDTKDQTLPKEHLTIGQRRLQPKPVDATLRCSDIRMVGVMETERYHQSGILVPDTDIQHQVRI
jgi:hypothetical protein